jgi:hypothetical protein
MAQQMKVVMASVRILPGLGLPMGAVYAGLCADWCAGYGQLAADGAAAQQQQQAGALYSDFLQAPHASALPTPAAFGGLGYDSLLVRMDGLTDRTA